MDGCACAGAAIGQLVYGKPKDAEEVGEELYGDHDAFFKFHEKGVDRNDPTSVAKYVARLEPSTE
jgi:hypothetical protein